MTTTAPIQTSPAPSADHPDQRKGRILQLDVLRGIAILMVLWYHAVVPPERAGIFKPIADLGVNIGWSGVQLFFVLSGFLIGGLLMKEIRTRGRLNVPRFLIRRGLKIWPGYYLLMAFVFVKMLHQKQGLHHSTIDILPSLFALQNYLGTVRGHIWSLAVEEHFYLALPALLFFLPVRNRNGKTAIPAIPLIAAAVGLLVLTMRYVVEYTSSNLTPHRWGETQWNIDAMFFGVLLAYLYQFHYPIFARFASRWQLVPLAFLLLGPQLFAIPLPRFIDPLNHTFMYLAFGMILMVFMQAKPQPALANAKPSDGQPINSLLTRALNGPLARAIGFIGFYSYAIYLWFPDLTQGPLFYALEHHNTHLPRSLVWLAGNAVFIAASVAVGAILTKLVELPMLALRDRWFPARASITTTPTK